MRNELISTPRELLKRLEQDLPWDSSAMADLQALLAGADERRSGSTRLPPERVASDSAQDLSSFDRGWNACLEKVTELNRPQLALTLLAEEGEPEVFIHVHELIENGGGIWMGSPDAEVVIKSRTEGETGTEVFALVRLDAHREHVAHLVAEIERLREALKVSEVDASRWQSLMTCGRVRTLGRAGLLDKITELRAALEAESQDASRWRAVVGCARVRALGSAGLTSDFNTYNEPYGDYAHLGLELWTVHSAGSEPTAIEWLIKFADKAVAVMQAKKGEVEGEKVPT